MALDIGKVYNEGYDASMQQALLFDLSMKAIVDTENKRYFSRMGDVQAIKKHHGKTFKMPRYMPILCDANINNEGIDATENHDEFQVTIIVTEPNGRTKHFPTGQGTTGNAVTAAQNACMDMLTNMEVTGIVAGNYASTVTALELKGWTFEVLPERPNYGNMYGSSRDFGVLVSKLPNLSEKGGRINRVGHTRIFIEGSLSSYGFFTDYTQDSIDFDNDAQLMYHMIRELMITARQNQEDRIQYDLVSNAGCVRYGGSATDRSELTGESTAEPSVLSYKLLYKVANYLDKVKCPKNTKMVTGSTLEDTKTINSARFAFIGPELKYQIEHMTNDFGQVVFKPVREYAAGADYVHPDEFGAVGDFRFIVNQDMCFWAGEGATVSDNAGYIESGGKYDVFPVLIVGDDSFATLTFEPSGSDIKSQRHRFQILCSKPGKAEYIDPYGKTGIWSIQWKYGFLAKRPERIVCIEVVAPR